MSKPVINVNNLGKTYWLFPTLGKRLLGCFINPRMVGGHAFTALEGLSFDLYPGEAIALIGKNGAGKSTALQVLAGITPATEGNFQINGRVCALLELGSGFNPEFTGRQNIALAGILLGLTHEQVKEEEQNIIDFADIGEFIDQPVKFYSSGMFVRLAFAVAVAGTPDLLIVDEALAVGDIFFRQKCYARLHEMREKGMAVILVTHSSGDVQEFCDRAILLEHGRQVYAGDPQKTMLKYYFSTQSENTPSITAEEMPVGAMPQGESNRGHPWPEIEPFSMPCSLGRQEITPGAILSRFCIMDEKNRPAQAFAQGATIKIYFEYQLEMPVEIPTTSVTIWSDSGVAVYCASTALQDVVPESALTTPGTVYACHEIILDIAPGEYTLSCGLAAVSPDIFAKREFCSPEDWGQGTQRLANIRDLATISIVLPLSRSPSRVTTFGLVNLESKSSLICHARS